MTAPRPWLLASWSRQPRPVSIGGPADLHAAIDAVYQLIGSGDAGEMLVLSRADGAELEVWLDVPSRGGWAFGFTDAGGRCWVSGSGPFHAGEPDLDFRYYDAWNQMPVSSFVPGPSGRRALFEFAATGQLPNSIPWRAF